MEGQQVNETSYRIQEYGSTIKDEYKILKMRIDGLVHRSGAIRRTAGFKIP